MTPYLDRRAVNPGLSHQATKSGRLHPVQEFKYMEGSLLRGAVWDTIVHIVHTHTAQAGAHCRPCCFFDWTMSGFTGKGGKTKGSAGGKSAKAKGSTNEAHSKKVNLCMIMLYNSSTVVVVVSNCVGSTTTDISYLYHTITRAAQFLYSCTSRCTWTA